MNDKDYIDKLEKTLGILISPLDNIPIKFVLKHLSGFEIIHFDTSNLLHAEILEKLKSVAIHTSEKINNQGGIKSQRVNEVGNKIEPLVKQSLIDVGYLNANSPSTLSNKKKLVGYPDLSYKHKTIDVYLECKTYNSKSLSTTLRSFYFSPSKDFKVTSSGLHLLIGFEIEKTGNHQNLSLYKVSSWKITKLDRLDVSLKQEFNSSNRYLYRDDLVLASGKIS